MENMIEAASVADAVMGWVGWSWLWWGSRWPHQGVLPINVRWAIHWVDKNLPFLA